MRGHALHIESHSYRARYALQEHCYALASPRSSQVSVQPSACINSTVLCAPCPPRRLPLKLIVAPRHLSPSLEYRD